MGRRVLWVVLALFLTVTVVAAPAGAVETGSITVEWGKESGSVTLFKVGSPISGGYMLRQEFGGGVITKKDVSSQALAQWLWEHVEYEGWTLPADEQGRAEYQRLEEGLYLIIQNQGAQGYYPFPAFLAELPSEGQWNVLARPKMEEYPTEQPRTGQGMGLYFGIAGMMGSGVLLAALLPKKRKR